MEVNSLNSIKTICLSHLHGDHFMGISSLLWYFTFTNRRDKLTIIGPSPVKEIIEKISGLLTGITKDFTWERPFELHFIELKSDDKVLNIDDDYNIKYAEMDHTIKAFAYRIEKGDEVVCYSGDTRPTQNLVELARNCDLFICESTFSDDKAELAYQTGHCTPSDAAKMARDADCEKLVFVHFSPPFSELVRHSIEGVKDIFDKEIMIADDLLTIEIP